MEIKLTDIVVRRNHENYFDHLNMELDHSDIYGLMGKRKTLLLELIDAIVKPDKGTIQIKNDVVSTDTLLKVRKNVALIAQDASTQFFEETIAEEMKFIVQNLDYHHKNIEKKMKDALIMVGLDESYFTKKIMSLSTSEIKRLQIAVGLLVNPKLILLDEPFVDLDFKSKRNLMKLIRLLKERYHKTILIASNQSDLLYPLVDEMLVLKEGKIHHFENATKFFQDESLLQEYEIPVPDLVRFTLLAKKKKIKLSFHRDIRDLIKDVYKHV